MRVVIIGAGLSGLSAAWHLAQAGVETLVFEKEQEAGGACRTVVREGFAFDFTGHLLHLRLPESHHMLRQLGLGKAFRRHKRRAGILLAGHVTPYPIQIHTARLPREIRRDCLVGFVRAWARGQEDDGSFGSWVLSRFGEGFARHFFFPYNRKLFCTDPFRLTTEWVGRYVPRPELDDVVNGALGLFSKARAVGYNAWFLYPRVGGIGVLAEHLAARVPKLFLRSPVVAVSLSQRQVVLAGGERVGFDSLIATCPLPQLVAMAEPVPPELREKAKVLSAVAVWNLNVAVRGKPRRREHWVYCPEEDLPFYRVGFPSNHGVVAPRGFHTISVEVSVRSGSSPAAGWEEVCLAALEKVGFLASREDVVLSHVARVDPAYVIFDPPRTQTVAALRHFFRGYGVFLCGRWAEWKYSTMEDALWDGAAVARKVVQR